MNLVERSYGDMRGARNSAAAGVRARRALSISRLW